MTTTLETAAATLARIRAGHSSNDDIVLDAFTRAGYSNVVPRETVLTYRAWRAAGRQVRKGQHGIKVTTYAPARPRKGETPNPAKRPHLIPRSVSLFHISQTDPIA